MTSSEMLAIRRGGSPVVQQGPIQRSYMWGTQKPPPLHFGGNMYPPEHPLYQLIQGIILQQKGLKEPQIMGNQG